MLQEQVKNGMPVVGSNGVQFALVDHMDGQQNIKLKKGDGPTHHWIPLSWVTSADGGTLRVDRTSQDATRQWSAQGPQA